MRPTAEPPGRLLAAAVFDLDGLLVDSEPLWRRAEIQIFTALGLPMTAELVASTQGRYVGEVARHWYQVYGWTGPGPDEVAADIIDAVEQLLMTEGTLKPGAAEAVASCRRRGLRLAVASSSPLRLIRRALEPHRLTGVFDVLHSAEAEAAGKPDPAVYRTTAARLGVSSDACVAFEDSLAGVASARAAGMRCVAVPEGPVTDPDLWATADLVLESLAELDTAWEALEAAGR